MTNFSAFLSRLGIPSRFQFIPSCLAIILGLALFAGPAAAQSSVYFVGGGGTANNGGIGMFALGGEWVSRIGVGVGAEAGGITGSNVFGTGSINGSFHFKRFTSNPKLDPFVSGGYSWGFQLFDSQNGFNVGGGVNYWFLRHLAIRAEVRDFGLNTTYSGMEHNFGVRAGIAIH